MKRTITACLFFVAALISQGAVAASGDEWSEPIRGLRARLTFGEGKIVAGVRLPEVYLELQNISDVGTPMEFDFDEEKSLRFELRAADGKPAQKPGAMVVDGFVFGPFRLTLPMGSTLRFPVTWHGYGIRSGLGAALCLHSAFWEISSTDRNDYFLSATLNIPQTPREENKTWAWYGTIKIPAAKAPTKK